MIRIRTVCRAVKPSRRVGQGVNRKSLQKLIGGPARWTRSLVQTITLADNREARTSVPSTRKLIGPYGGKQKGGDLYAPDSHAELPPPLGRQMGKCVGREDLPLTHGRDPGDKFQKGRDCRLPGSADPHSKAGGDLPLGDR